MLGGLAGLQDPSVMAQKKTDEEKLLAGLTGEKHAGARQAFGDVRQALGVYKEVIITNSLLERGSAFHTELFGIARTLVRLAAEQQQDNADRLREYRESNLESLKQSLFSEAPIYNDLEIVKLADSLGMYIELAGADDPLLLKVLAGKSPQERAAELVNGTKLKDVAERKRLAEGGAAAIEKSNDPLIQLARLVDGPARAVRKKYDEQVEEPLRQAYAKIAAGRFAVTGSDTYPDATFTLRLAYGTVKGYQERGEKVPPWTTIGKTFQHAEAHGSVEPFELPESWLKAQDKLKSGTPFNFVSTADIIGGNSGSPVVNRAGEVVGIIFDGNIQSLVLNFVYTDEQARAVSVHSAGIMEALRTVYGATRLVDELSK
jgi:hypothetical protein